MNPCFPDVVARSRQALQAKATALEVASIHACVSGPSTYSLSRSLTLLRMSPGYPTPLVLFLVNNPSIFSPQMSQLEWALPFPPGHIILSTVPQVWADACHRIFLWCYSSHSGPHLPFCSNEIHQQPHSECCLIYTPHHFVFMYCFSISHSMRNYWLKED